MSDIGKIFGLAVRDARKRLGIHQEELAKLIGVSRVTVTYIETGRYAVRFENALMLAHILQLDMNDFKITDVKILKRLANEAAKRVKIKELRKEIERVKGAK